MPKDVREVRLDGKILLIAPLYMRWIVLDNEFQLAIFHLLAECSVAEAKIMMPHECSERDFSKVLVELEAKRFCESAQHQRVTERLQIYLTNECNLRCPHCYMSAGVKGNGELTTDEVFDLLDNFAAHGGECVVFSGGEVALRKDLADVVLRASGNGLRVELLTNGILWDDNKVRALAPCLSRVQISIDGVNEDDNAVVRGVGNYQIAIDSVDRFIKAGCRTVVAVTPPYIPNMKRKARRFAEWARQLRSRWSQELFDVIFTTGIMDGRGISYTQEQKSEYETAMEQVYVELGGHNTKEDAFLAQMKRNEKMESCNYGQINISSTGDVYACSRVTCVRPFGNIRKDDFNTIWAKARALRSAANVANIASCRECDLMYICGSNCRIENFDEFSGATSPDDLTNISSRPKTCTKEWKQGFYRSMININARLYE